MLNSKWCLAKLIIGLLPTQSNIASSALSASLRSVSACEEVPSRSGPLFNVLIYHWMYYHLRSMRLFRSDSPVARADWMSYYFYDLFQLVNQCGNTVKIA
ncbi:hypothetical protein C8R43DRAFT_51643 [Mycena crocata]|nr:hypothetical protein C8R43DRAFT_51643 [Mycena crocata]